MYFNVSNNQLKDLNKKLHNLVKDELEEKNLEFQDVQMVISVELKDESKPSKTLVEFTRKQKLMKSSFKDSFKELLGNLSNGIDKDKSEEKNKLFLKETLEKVKEENKKKEEELYGEMLALFKKMLKDEDNKLVLFVKNDWVELKKDLSVDSVKELPTSIVESLNSGALIF